MRIHCFFLFFALQQIQGFVFKSQINRNLIKRYSHFSTITTTLKDKDILIQSLLDVNPYLMIYEGPEVVLDYNKNEIVADIIVRQDNGSEICFCLKDEKYEMISDLQFW